VYGVGLNVNINRADNKLHLNTPASFAKAVSVVTNPVKPQRVRSKSRLAFKVYSRATNKIRNVSC